MIRVNCVLLEERRCARGYSITLLKEVESNRHVICLCLDGAPYWSYRNLNSKEAWQALDDLELLPGPRGDSSWRGVLSRCVAGVEDTSLQVAPVVMGSKVEGNIGTWEWVKELTASRLKTAGQL